MYPLSRRSALRLFTLPAAQLFARQAPPASNQGMATRGVKAAPRRKPSGLPFHARFTDVAAHAGLKAITVCGHPKRADYVIEAMGCGCAFFDYDNDGWLDILVLTGSRSGDPAGNASNRLYKNNRDGTFTDVTEKAGLFRTGYWYGVTVGDYDNDGFEDLFITGYPHNVLYKNNGNGTFTDVTKEAGLVNARSRGSAPAARLSITIATENSICSSRTMFCSIRNRFLAPGISRVAMTKKCSAGRAGFPTATTPSIATMATAPSAM